MVLHHGVAWYFMALYGISMVFYGIPGAQAEVKAESGIAEFLPDRIDFFGSVVLEPKPRPRRREESRIFYRIGSNFFRIGCDLDWGEGVRGWGLGFG